MVESMRESARSPVWEIFAKQAAFIAALLFFLFVSFATYSYHPADPGWFYSGAGGPVYNSMGALGANIADISSAFFGSLFLTLPPMFLLTTLVVWRNPHALQPFTNAVLCTLGGILYLSFGATLCFLHSVGAEYQYGSGGILGSGLGHLLYRWIGYDGATLVSLSLLVISLTLMLQLQWLKVIEQLGMFVLRLIQRVANKYQDNKKARLAEAAFAEADLADATLVDEHNDLADFEEPAVYRKQKSLDRTLSKTSPKRVSDFTSGTTSDLTSGIASDIALEEMAPEDIVLEEIVEEAEPSVVKRLFGYLKVGSARRSQTPQSESSSHSIEPEIGDFTAVDLYENNHVDFDDVSLAFEDTLYIEDAPETSAHTIKEPRSEKASLTGEKVVQTSKSVPANKPAQTSQPVQTNQPAAVMEEALPVPPSTELSSKAPSLTTNEAELKEHKPAVKVLSEAKQLQALGSSETTLSSKSAESLYSLPDRSVLTPAKPKQGGYTEEQLLDLSELLEQRLLDFGVKAEVVEVNPGPVITRFEIQPAPGVKVSRITNLAKDLARSLSVLSVRVVEVIAGKSTIGIEIPNQVRDTVHFSEVINCVEYDQATSPLTLSLGHDISGEPVVVDLAKMPHVLVAGTTGSGKSVGVNAMILSMLLKSTPDEVRMIMVDPKMLELSIYEGIPHLLTPVITDMKDAANGLRWSVDEMERRYKLMSKLGVRNIAGYNKKVREAIDAGSPLEDPLWQPEHTAMFSQDGVARSVPLLEPLPYIVIIVDEFADMMMIVGKKVEELIARIAHKARAAGIHLLLATQRPSVDVITGLIKANIPTRMAFQVSSKIDSRTILDQGGADQLLGMGDMLYLPAGLPTPIRVHGAFVSDEEVHAVVEEWRMRGEPEYINDVVTNPDDLMSAESATEDKDALYDEAVKIVIETRKASISSIQRRLKIGYNRAANLVEAMEAAGLVSSMGTNGQREVLIPE